MRRFCGLFKIMMQRLLKSPKANSVMSLSKTPWRTASNPEVKNRILSVQKVENKTVREPSPFYQNTIHANKCAIWPFFVFEFLAPSKPWARYKLYSNVWHLFNLQPPKAAVNGVLIKICCLLLCLTSWQITHSSTLNNSLQSRVTGSEREKGKWIQRSKE